MVIYEGKGEGGAALDLGFSPEVDHFYSMALSFLI